MIILLDLLMGFSIRCPPRAGDDEIAKDIEDKIAAYLDFQDSQVKVSVKGGMVMWTDALPENRGTMVKRRSSDGAIHTSPSLSGHVRVRMR